MLLAITQFSVLEAPPGRISLTDVLNGLKYCPAILATVGINLPNKNVRVFSTISIDFKVLNCPSFRSVRNGSKWNRQ
jgi:hypothetical protein